MKKLLLIVLTITLLNEMVSAQLPDNMPNLQQTEAFANTFLHQRHILAALKEQTPEVFELIKANDAFNKAAIYKLHKDRFQFQMKFQQGILNYKNGKEYAAEIINFYVDYAKAILKDSSKINEFISYYQPKEEHKLTPENAIPINQMRAAGDPCTNSDLETCSFASWDLFQGSVDGSVPYSYVGVTSTGPGAQHTITTGAGNDAIVPIPRVNPDGGTCSMMLGNGTTTGSGAASMRQTFLVSNASAVFTYSYAAVLQDPVGHGLNEKPYFKVRMYDASNNPIVCGDYEVIAGGSSGGDPSFILTTYGGEDLYYKPWSTVFAPLQAYIGQNVTIEFTVGDCSQSGHFGYAYVEADCNPLAILSTTPPDCSSPTVNLTAPPGAASYLWSNGATTQSITVGTSGNYSVTITPVTGSSCSVVLDTTVTVGVLPPIANGSNDGPVCIGTAINFTDLSNPNGSPITAWDWDFGDGNTSTQQNPSHTYAAGGTYNVTLTVTNGALCQDVFNMTVTVNTISDPTINPAGPFCGTDAPVVLTAATVGGSWTATCGACINAATGLFDPAIATTGNNTITYTITGSCGAVDTEVILIENISAPVIVSTDIDCFGNCIGTITMTATGATQFSNDGGATFQATGNFNSLCANTYNLVAESAIGCQVTGTATIVEPLPLLLPTAFTDETCFGSCDGVAIVAPQDGTSPYSYSWSNGGGNVPTISNLCVGIYTVTVTDDNGCVEVANITVGGPTQVLITSIVEVDESCTNSCDGSITITAPLATQFSIDGGVTFQASNVFNGVCSGTYNVVVQDATPCQATGTATVTTPNPLNIIAGPNSTICIGQSATVSATANGGTAPITLIWDNGLPNGSPHTVTPAANTTYTVFAQDGNGCSTSPVQITVTLNPPLQVTALSDQDICPGFSANISASASGGNGGPYTYVWDDGAGNILNGANQTVSPAVTTSYTVTASDNCGTPVATDVVTITVNPLPVVTFTADNLQGCTPVSVNFTNTTNAALTGTCFWDFGDGTTSTNCTPNHVYTVPGCYTVTLTVTSPDGCVASATVTNMICVFAYPVAEFSFGPQPTDILQTEISFTNETTLGVAYEWDFAGLGTSQSTNPVFVFPNIDPGTYPVCLATVSADGCVDTICHDVIILDLFLIYVPNTFTPDNDGVNDFFFPVIDGYDPLNFKMMIFNRWGELIFETEIPENKWDGTYKGIMSKEDTYVWKILTKDVGTGKKREFIGHVNLLK